MAEPVPHTVTLAAAMVARLHEHSQKTVNASDNTAVAAMRDGIHLAAELLRLPGELPVVNPNQSYPPKKKPLFSSTKQNKQNRTGGGDGWGSERGDGGGGTRGVVTHGSWDGVLFPFPFLSSLCLADNVGRVRFGAATSVFLTFWRKGG